MQPLLFILHLGYGRPLTADAATRAVYALITVAALLRLAAPLSGAR